MGVQYNKARVDAWFEKVGDTLDAYGLSHLWLELAYNPKGPVDIEPLWVWDEWLDFSLWEQQRALYLFVPRIEKNAQHQAWLLSQKARKHEPL